MPPVPSAPKWASDGNFIDTDTGLTIPRSYKAPYVVDEEKMQEILNSNSIDGRGFSKGHVLERDTENLAVYWPHKGSGWDDIVNQSIVNGDIANVGLSPVIAPQISAMVRRHQSQAMTASIDLTGRTFPVGQAREAIARFNDSPLGVTEALQRIVYGIDTYNRGAPIAFVPIIYDPESWGDFGIEARPFTLPNKGRRRKSGPRLSDTYYYLEVDWSKHGQPIPFLPNVYDLEPTGIKAWPYWYRTKMNDRVIWVLLHKTHILELLPGPTSAPGLGTSPVWTCLGVLAEQILFVEERAEKLLYSMTDGITILGGVSGLSASKIRQAIDEARTGAKDRGFIVAKGNTILTSPTASAVSAVTVSFRQPSGVDFDKWRQYVEDVIAAAFGETLSALVLRGGVGYGTQADTASENMADAGVGAILTAVSMALGVIYPRVHISISRPNDRNQRLNIQTLSNFAAAASSLVEKGILTPVEAKAIIDRDILAIPRQGIDTVIASPNAGESKDPTVDTTSVGNVVEPEPAIASPSPNGNGRRPSNGTNGV
jgi:hypothetical protein